MARLLFWLAPFYTSAIIVLSLLDNNVPVIEISHSDKFYHAVAYTIMSILWYFFFYNRYLLNANFTNITITTILKNWSKTIGIAAAVLSFIVGVFVELAQEYVSVNRTMDVLDAMANLAGIIIALILLYVISIKFNAD